MPEFNRDGTKVTRGDFISATVDLVAATMMTYVVTDGIEAFQEWFTSHPNMLPEFFHREDMTDEFFEGAAEAFIRIAMGEDPEYMIANRDD